MRKMYDHTLFEEFLKSKSKYEDILYSLYNNSFNTIINNNRNNSNNISIDIFISNKLYKDYRRLINFPIYLMTDCYIKLLNIMIIIFLMVYSLFYFVKNLLIPFLIDFKFIDIWSDLLSKGTIFLITVISLYVIMYVLDRFIYYLKNRDITTMFKNIETKGIDGEVIKKYFDKDFNNETPKILLPSNYYKVKFNDGTFKLLNTATLFEILFINYLKLQNYNLNDFLSIKDNNDGTYIFEFKKLYGELITQIKYKMNTSDVNTLVSEYIKFLEKEEQIQVYELVEVEELDQVHLFGQDFSYDLIDLLIQNTPNYENTSMLDNLEDTITSYLRLVINQYKITGYNENELNEIKSKLKELNQDVDNLENLIHLNNLNTKNRLQKLKREIKVIETLVSLPSKKTSNI